MKHRIQAKLNNILSNTIHQKYFINHQKNLKTSPQSQKRSRPQKKPTLANFHETTPIGIEISAKRKRIFNKFFFYDPAHNTHTSPHPGPGQGHLSRRWLINLNSRPGASGTHPRLHPPGLMTPFIIRRVALNALLSDGRKLNFKKGDTFCTKWREIYRRPISYPAKP